MTEKLFVKLAVVGIIRLYTTHNEYKDYEGDEVLNLINNQHETILQLQDRIKSLDKPLTQIMLLLLDDEFRSKLTDVEWEAFEELSKFNGDIK